MAWRDTGIPGTSFPCGTGPPWFPITHESIVDFDTETNPQIPNPGDPLALPFPVAAGRVLVGGSEYPVAIGKADWAYLNLDESFELPGAPFGTVRQAWVWAMTEDEGLGRFNHAGAGVQLHNASGESVPQQRLEKWPGGGR